MTSIRFAVLGTAKIARTVAPRIQTSSGAELLGIASRDKNSADSFAAEFDIPRSYGSYQEALNDPDIDAVYIPLPPSMHAEWTLRAAEAGKHVLCEKPLARNTDEAEQMIAACEAAKVVLLDGVMWYHTPRAAEIQKVVSGGQLGELRQFTSVFTFCWDTMPMDNLRLHRNMGGGALLDLGWYCVGAALLLFNEMPEQVFASAQWCNDVDTRMNAFLWFSNNGTASIECGFDTVRRRWFEIAGSKRTLQCRDFTRPFEPDSPGFVTVDGDGDVSETVIRHKPQEECMVEAFCDLIHSNIIRHPLLSLSGKTQMVCDALDRSARQQMVVRL